MQVPLCFALLELLGRRACSRLSCSSRALQHKYRQEDERECTHAGSKGSLKYTNHFFSVCDHWQLKQQKEEQRAAGKCLCFASSRVLFQSSAALCQHQGQSGIMRWQHEDEANPTARAVLKLDGLCILLILYSVMIFKK